MRLRWTSAALRDLGRLHDFLAAVNPAAAANSTRTLTAAPLRLLRYPLAGLRLFEYDDRDVRRIIIGAYELRYELRVDEIVILRLWHMRAALSALVKGRAQLSPEMALRIEKAFGVSMDTLMRMQNSFDIAQARTREADINFTRFISEPLDAPLRDDVPA